MRAGGVEPNLATFNAALSVCAKAGQAQAALSLLGEMRSAGVKPDEYTFISAISACKKGGRGEAAAALAKGWDRAGEWPESLTFNAALLQARARTPTALTPAPPSSPLVQLLPKLTPKLALRRTAQVLGRSHGAGGCESFNTTRATSAPRSRTPPNGCVHCGLRG